MSEIKVNLVKLDDIDLPEVIYKYRSWKDEYHRRFI